MKRHCVREDAGDTQPSEMQLLWKCYGPVGSTMYVCTAGSHRVSHRTSISVPPAPWFARRWAKRRGVGDLCSSHITDSTRVASLNELARLEISILQACTEKKVLLL